MEERREPFMRGLKRVLSYRPFLFISLSLHVSY
jgi:hypothetical protein